MPIDYTKLRNLTARDIIAALIKDGFSLRHQKGSHQRYRHPDGRRVHRAQRVAVEDIAALDADDLARGDCADSEESLAVNPARADGGFGRDVGQVRHWR